MLKTDLTFKAALSASLACVLIQPKLSLGAEAAHSGAEVFLEADAAPLEADSAVPAPADAVPAAGDGAAAAANDAAPSSDAGSTDSLESVIVTGTRETNVKARDSSAPIDVLPAAALQATGATDLRDALERVLPSLNHAAFAGDYGALTDTVQLRGLSPDHVLILINGKRRHTTANIYTAGGPLQGSAPVDLDLIPLSAIDHIEVLRDGAAAQYGSDAIAGVINIILKSANHGGTVTANAGQYYDGGGFTAGGGGDVGTTLTDDGFLHLGGDYRHHNHSVRSGADSRTGVVDNLIFGDPEVERESIAYNAGKSFAANTVEVYSFATYAHRDGQSYENYRLPTVIPSVYPKGFSPQATIDENDYAATLGIKGDQLLGWSWDLSSTYGGDNDGLGLIDSGNPALAAAGTTPTTFHIANFKITQWTNTLDFNRPFEIGLAAPLNVAFGGEWRRETYQIRPGDPASYQQGGAQSEQGLSPVNAGSYGRSNSAGYIDLATSLLPLWQVDIAARHEHFTDFGDTTSGKLSTRYDFNSRLGLRATVSNGFRAPSLAQEFYASLGVSPTGASGQIAAGSPAAKALGAGTLGPEKSISFSLGAVAEPVDGLHATVDGYFIRITNRIVDGGSYAGEQAIAALEANGVTFPPGINPANVTAVFFSNGADTKTYGVDLTADYRSDLGRAGTVDWDAAVNYNRTLLTRLGLDGNGNPLLDAQQIAYLTSASPESKIIVGGIWKDAGFLVSLHEIRYGKSAPLDQYYTGPNAFSITTFYESVNPAKYVTNLELGYDWRGLQWVVGANNLFNVYPKELPPAQRYIGAALYDGYTGLGINGGYYYTRLSYKF
jgi:iron complex outermembrane receptor protein